jgi:pimeloyl-ACP methyl ester carboxylesterase
MAGLTSGNLVREDGERIAYLTRPGSGPGIVWLGGFKSEMTGTKATAMDEWADRAGRAVMRFDYFGHGRSTGNFRDGTITRWLGDILAVLDELTEGPQIFVGSSMGGWLALLAALARPHRVAALVLLAPAVDFTQSLMWETFDDEAKRQILETGEWLRPSAYDPKPYPITRGLIEDGRKHLLLGKPVALTCPVRIVQGMKDPDVPWQHATKLVEALGPDTNITLVKDGDHRLSQPRELALIMRTVSSLLAVDRQ